MREFLDLLEECGELRRVAARVDPQHEIGAICKVLNERPDSPAVLFENVAGSTLPVVAQLLASNRRIALALGVSEDAMFEETVRRATRPLPPTTVASGACQEVVLEGDAVDLRQLPICTNNPADGGPYITAGHVFIEDPEYGKNLSIYRMMLRSRNEVFLRFTPGHDGYDFFQAAEQRGATRFPVAVAIGVEPAIHLASQFEPAAGVYELDTAGGLRGAPVEMVRCRTVDLEVPAAAEIILEGEIGIPPATGTEGPFGEFVGYTTEAVPNERILRVTAITHRRQPIYHNIWLGKPPHEHLWVDGLTYGVAAYLELKATYPALKKAYAPPWGQSIVLVMQVHEHLKRPGLVDNLLAASLFTRSGMWKHVLVVDEDINVYDPNELLWAFTSPVQPARDTFIIPKGFTSRLEPSATSEGVTSKLMIDATMKPGFRGTVAEPTPEMRAYVRGRWREYGLD
jgi:UbiD family decarboxylase